jgi:DNA-binding NtrC family response regulator
MSEKVLLVDDEQEFLNALGERMRLRDMDVSTTTSAKEALRKIEEESYDAIILDLKMPEIGGLEVLKAIKARHPELQIILLTGHGTVQAGVEAMKLGAVDFLEKPADLEALTKKIHEAKAQKMLVVEKKIEEKVKAIIEGKPW